MQISRLFIYDGSNGSTKAFIDLETSEGIILKGFKLILGPKGMFVGAPSEKGKDGKWRESVIVPSGLKDEINRMAVSEYDRIRTSGNSAPEYSHNNEGPDLPF